MCGWNGPLVALAAVLYLKRARKRGLDVIRRAMESRIQQQSAKW